MTKKDISQVSAIEAETFEDPWSRHFFEECLRGGCCCLVLEDAGQVLAYGIALMESRIAHIMNLCVHPGFRRRKLGRRMLSELLTSAKENNANIALLEVRPSNIQAIALYRSAGFVQLGIRKNYYRRAQGREDALVMTCPL